MDITTEGGSLAEVMWEPWVDDNQGCIVGGWDKA